MILDTGYWILVELDTRCGILDTIYWVIVERRAGLDIGYQQVVVEPNYNMFNARDILGL